MCSEFVTLDGVIEAPGGEETHPYNGWVTDYQGEEQMAYKFKEVVDAETLLIGVVTYGKSFAGVWPYYEGEFADLDEHHAKVVVSSTLTDPEWDNTTVLDGDVVAGRHRGSRSRMVVRSSSPEVTRSCTRCSTTTWSTSCGLMVFPVTIGPGLRMFPETLKKSPWKAVDSLPSRRGARRHVPPRGLGQRAARTQARRSPPRSARDREGRAPRRGRLVPEGEGIAAVPGTGELGLDHERERAAPTARFGHESTPCELHRRVGPVAARVGEDLVAHIATATVLGPEDDAGDEIGSGGDHEVARVGTATGFALDGHLAAVDRGVVRDRSCSSA